jgi:hypothetical protein
VFLVFLVHCDRPFVGPVYKVILALARNVRNGSLADMSRSTRDVRFTPPKADIRPRDQDVCFGSQTDMGYNAASRKRRIRRIRTFLFSLNFVGRWRARSVRRDERQSESAVAGCRCKPLAGRNAGRLGYHRTSAASCRYLQCGCTIERKPAKQDRAQQSRPATMNFDLVDIAIVVTLAYLLRLFAAGAVAGTPDNATPLIAKSFQSYRNDEKFIPRHRSTNGRVIPGVAKVGVSLSDNFFITS